MNIMYRPLELNIAISENVAYVICAENADIFSDMVKSLYVQSAGGEGSFIIFDADKELSVSKSLDFVMNPFAVDINSRKILGSLYRSLDEMAGSEMVKEKNELNAYIQNFIGNLLMKSPYQMDFDQDISVTDLLKTLGVKIADSDSSLAERLCSYVRAMSDICCYRIFVFYDLKSFLSEDDLSNFYSFCFYQKVFPMIIESHQSPPIQYEKTLIIDRDRCIIYT